MQSKKEKPLVSVIVPLFNKETLVKAALESILVQKYSPLEIIVIDDGSTDESAKIVKSFPQIRYFWQKNQGVGAARNAGIKKAKGKIIAFLDADDLWPPDNLSYMVSKIKRVDRPQVIWGYCQWRFLNNFEENRKFMKRFTRPTLLALLGSAVYTRPVFKKTGLIVATRFAEDVDFFIRLAQQKIKITTVRKVVLIYNRHHGNMTSEIDDDRSIPDLLFVLKRHINWRRKGNGRSRLILNFAGPVKKML